MGAVFPILLMSFPRLRGVRSPARDHVFRKHKQGSWDLNSGSLCLKSELS